MSQFRIGDEVIVVKVETNQKKFLHGTFKIEKIVDAGQIDATASGTIANKGNVSLFLYKLEHLYVYESPLNQELK